MTAERRRSVRNRTLRRLNWAVEGMKDSLQRLQRAANSLDAVRRSAADVREVARGFKRKRGRARRSTPTVRRAEFEAVLGVIGRRGELIERLVRDNDLHFRRIAQLQAEVDAISAQLSSILQRFSGSQRVPAMKK
jgi:ABC-type transporter Mla subunit MlaD